MQKLPLHLLLGLTGINFFRFISTWKQIFIYWSWHFLIQHLVICWILKINEYIFICDMYTYIFWYIHVYTYINKFWCVSVYPESRYLQEDVHVYNHQSYFSLGKLKSFLSYFYFYEHKLHVLFSAHAIRILK